MEEKKQNDILQELRDLDITKKRFEDSILHWMSAYYKKEKDKKSRVGKKFKEINKKYGLKEEEVKKII